MRYVLDSDTFTLAFYSARGVRDRIAAARAAGNDIEVSAITRYEVLRGRIEAVLKAASGADVLRMLDRLTASEAYLAEFIVTRLDPTAADLFDRYKSEKATRKLSRGDLLTACVALAHAATLVTRNTKDFAPIPGLLIENWAD